MSCGRWCTTDQTRQRRGVRVREWDLGVGEGMLEREGNKETNSRTSTCTLGTRFSVLGSSTATYGFQASGVENIQTVSPPLHYSASWKDLDVLHQAHTEPREETASVIVMTFWYVFGTDLLFSNFLNFYSSLGIDHDPPCSLCSHDL